MSLSILKDPFGNKLAETLRERCGPSEFADLVFQDFQRRRGYDADLVTPTGPEAIRELIEFAYFASLKTEEGRAITPRIVLTADSGTLRPYRPLSRFTRPESLTVQLLGKLAPALAEGCAFWVTADETTSPALICHGILDCRGFPRPALGANYGVGDFSEAVYENHPNVDVIVLGPGDMKVTFGFRVTLLQAGVVRQFVPYTQVPFLQLLFEQVASRVVVEIKSNETKADKYLSDWKHSIPGDVQGWWSRVLDFMVSRRHGGTFVILPGLLDPSPFTDEIPADLDLGEKIAEFHLANCLLHTSEPLPEDPPNAHIKRNYQFSTRWLFAKAALETATEAVSALANVDGCVVLDREFRVKCFRAKIAQKNGPILPLIDWNDRSTSLALSMEQLGTRNNSACHFCQSYPGAVAFVVSQDQDLRVYCSDATSAYAFEHLSVPTR